LQLDTYMLKLDEGSMNVINAQMMNWQDLMQMFQLLEFKLNGYLYTKSHAHSHTH
jgi:hypothetical protein